MKQTHEFRTPIKIIGTGTVAGVMEGQGPLSATYDVVLTDDRYGEKTWEKAESKMQKTAVEKALINAGLTPLDVDLFLAGDLLNQCTGSCFAAREISIPFMGLYGACSTMAKSMALGAMLLNGEFGTNILCGTSSHFASAERQFRMPMEYGGKRTPTSQWTVTGAGMMLLSHEGDGPHITHATIGRIIDKGITDVNNMGAAMAPAAADTLIAHFRETGKTPADYDLIITGDLGNFGASLMNDMMTEAGYVITERYKDCGSEVFDTVNQDVSCGGSGCGCSAIVVTGHIMQELRAGNLNNVLFAGTGALMSTVSSQQGESIPGIAHAVAISRG